MTQEDKARAYDEALEKAKEILEMTSDKSAIYTIFPELAKSEEEKTREDMLEYCYKRMNNEFPSITIHQVKRWLAWLEKQGDYANFRDKAQVGDRITKNEDGVLVNLSQLKRVAKPSEQKPADKVEPKFHEGEWVVTDKNNVVQIKAIEDSKYVLENTMRFSVDYVDKCWRKWTIRDAKDGDVLATEDKNFTTPFVAIFKERGLDFFNSYCFIGFDGIFYEGEEGHDMENIHPATKEQCNLLFQKMNETGYEWDDEKKELKKIAVPIFHIGDRVRYKGHSCDGVITEITETDYICGDAKLPISTQDKLELIGQKSAWSEEDESRYSSCLYMLERETSLYNWFKSIKDRIQLQPQQEWSEKDSYYRNHIIQIIEEINNTPLKRGEDWESYINWLKSLGPQNRWKPTAAQIKVCKEVYADLLSAKGFYIGTVNSELNRLEEELKKLKEE